MREDHHESFLEQQEPLPPSERATGLVFAAAAAVIALVWRETPGAVRVAAPAAAVLTVTSFAAPAILRPLTTMWFRFGLLLHRVAGPLVLLLIFALVFVPAGFLMRMRYDPLRSKRDQLEPTYWIARGMDGAPRSMKDQF